MALNCCFKSSGFAHVSVPPLVSHWILQKAVHVQCSSSVSAGSKPPPKRQGKALKPIVEVLEPEDVDMASTQASAAAPVAAQPKAEAGLMERLTGILLFCLMTDPSWAVDLYLAL